MGRSEHCIDYYERRSRLNPNAEVTLDELACVGGVMDSRDDEERQYDGVPDWRDRQ